MMTRRLVELTLVAAVVPMVIVGVKTWRSRYDPAPETLVSLSMPARPQLGASRPARPQLGGVRTIDTDERVFTATVDDEVSNQPDRLESDESRRGASPAATRAVGNIRPFWTDPRSQDTSPSRGGSGGLRGVPGSAGPVASSTAPAATSAAQLPIVEFVGLMQNETLLKRDEFPAEQVRQLKITVWWTAAGKHSQRLELFTPDGVFYRRFAADFTGTGGGIRTPVDTLLPVGGSWITEYTLYGAWRVEVYLDADRTPTTTAAFVLNP